MWYVITTSVPDYEKWVKAYGVGPFVQLFGPYLKEKKDKSRELQSLEASFHTKRKRTFSSVIIFPLADGRQKAVFPGKLEIDFNRFKPYITDEESFLKVGEAIVPGLASQRGEYWQF